jgi:hypothetical protein
MRHEIGRGMHPRFNLGVSILCMKSEAFTTES